MTGIQHDISWVPPGIQQDVSRVPRNTVTVSLVQLFQGEIGLLWSLFRWLVLNCKFLFRSIFENTFQF